MKKYKVSVPIEVYVEIEVEVDEEEIKELDEDNLKDFLIDKANEEEGFYLTGYCGNGGSDKLVGVAGANVSVYPSEEAKYEEAEIYEMS